MKDGTGKLTAARLRIVTNNSERVQLKPKARSDWQSTREDLYGQVYLARITDRAWDRFYVPAVRLYHYLEIKSFRGTRLVRLTNDMAADVGLNRHHKSYWLKQLEAWGLVTVTRFGQKTPLVTVNVSPYLPPPSG
jgi:hypothetical protein